MDSGIFFTLTKSTDSITDQFQKRVRQKLKGIVNLHGWHLKLGLEVTIKVSVVG
jgi:hypothetical protein